MANGPSPYAVPLCVVGPQPKAAMIGSADGLIRLDARFLTETYVNAGDEPTPDIETPLQGDEEAIRRTAYFLWEQDGRPVGRAEDYWLRAREQHLRERAYDSWLREGSPEGRSDAHWRQAEIGKPDSD